MVIGESVWLEGHSGMAYEFFVFPLKETLSPVGGVYVVARRSDTSENNGQLQILFIGQSHDIAESRARFCEERDLMTDSDVVFGMHLEDENVEKRQSICEDLRTRYLPSADW